MRKSERQKAWAESMEHQRKAKAELQALFKKLETQAVKDANAVLARANASYARADHIHGPAAPVQWHHSGRPTSTNSTVTAGIYITDDHMKRKPGLPRTKETMPILAHRAAVLRATAKGIRLFSLSHGPLEIEADAECRCSNVGPLLHLSNAALAALPLDDRRRPLHAEVPHDRGSCGFYAVPADVDAMHAANTVDLLVELSGKVVEHEYGYRAGHQRILEARVMRACVTCGKDPEFLCFDTNGFEGFWPVCDEDVGTSNELGVPHIVSLARVSEIVGVPVIPMPK